MNTQAVRHRRSVTVWKYRQIMGLSHETIIKGIKNGDIPAIYREKGDYWKILIEPYTSNTDTPQQPEAPSRAR